MSALSDKVICCQQTLFRSGDRIVHRPPMPKPFEGRFHLRLPRQTSKP